MIYLVFFLLVININANSQNRWSIDRDGSISWISNNNLPHFDHIEMSGLKVSTVLRYGIDANGAFQLNRSMTWPMLRTIPNNTHASLNRRIVWYVIDMVLVNKEPLANEKVKEIRLDGVMTVKSVFDSKSLELVRELFPSVSNPAFCEKYTIKNTGQSSVYVEIPSSVSVIATDEKKGVYGSYRLVSTISGQSSVSLKQGEELSFSLVIAGYKNDEPEIKFDIDSEL
ncbi:MAG: hypothetical protein LBB53_05465, partial [Prevotellaceae bacterium]|nr:hypothetical protein [Prevotellaceae bacterium]